MYTMMQTCRETGLPYQTLKFYCNKGLVPNVQRDKNNRRIFSEADVRWIKDLSCLKKCGMSIEEMQRYLQLCLEGQPSIEARKAILKKKRAALVQQLADIQASIDYIDWKQQFYSDVQSGKREYISNLIPH